MSNYCVLSKNGRAGFYQKSSEGHLKLSLFNRSGNFLSEDSYIELDNLEKSDRKNKIEFVFEEKNRFYQDFLTAKKLIQSEKAQKLVVFNTFKFKGTFSPNNTNFKSLNLNNKYLYGSWSKDRGVIGLSPELIYEKMSDHYLIHSLAGTGSKLKLKEQKIIKEQEFVSNGILEDLKKHFDESEIKILDKKIINYGDFYHLKNNILLKRSDNQSRNIISLLQPTAAIGGYPRSSYKKVKNELIFEKIKEYQNYAGLFQFKAEGLDQCIVAIRSIQWTGNDIIIHAGCGMTKDSRFEDELNESRKKIENVIKEFNIEY